MGLRVLQTPAGGDAFLPSSLARVAGSGICVGGVIEPDRGVGAGSDLVLRPSPGGESPPLDAAFGGTETTEVVLDQCDGGPEAGRCGGSDIYGLG